MTVNENSYLTFDLTEVNTNIRDLVIFTFLAFNYTLTQLSLVDPYTNRGSFSTSFNQFNPKNVFRDFIVEY